MAYEPARAGCDHVGAGIVDNLVAHETLEGEQVEEIVKHWLR
jgi:hypothetical protein